MHPSLSTSYLLPAIFLNPVLFLHGFNTILSRIIPPIVVAGTVQPPPYSTFGPSSNHPHLDVHASDNLCWSYTVLMICAQLVAFGRVHRLREEGKERKRLKKESEDARNIRFSGKSAKFMANGHTQAQRRNATGGGPSNGKINGKVPREDSEDRLETTEHYSRGTSEEYNNPALILVTLAPESSTKQCPTLKLLLKDQNNHRKNRAPAPPSIEHAESSASSLVDVDSPHISSVPSDFESQATQTRTQADRMAHEAEDKARETSNKASQKTKETAADADQKASEASSKASGKAKEFSEYASEKSDELSKEAGDKYDKAKKSATRNYKEGKEEAKEKGNELSRNRDNPVVIGNAVIIGAGVATLGVMGYQKHVRGELSMQVAGITAAAVGAFAIADYYVSQWLFQNKYPKK